jgi:hypothetical protein
MRAFQGWLLTTVCFLTMTLGTEWLGRWIQNEGGVPTMNRAQHALFRMVVMGVAFSIASDLIHPHMQSYVKRLHGAVRPGRGVLAGVLGAVLLLAAVYAGYYFTYK